jgi:ABC-type proline/glycine betaine transport system ATPase subunit
VALLDEGRLVQTGTEREFRERPADAFVTEFLSAHFDEVSARG